MVTASHLPSDRNGFKFFSPSAPSGFSAQKIQELGGIVEDFIQTWMGNECDTMTLGSSSSVDDINSETVTNIESVDWMPRYKQSLKEAILSKTSTISATSSSSISSSVAQLTHEEEQRMRQPLTGLKIVLNSGNGAGGFFQTVLDELGADVSGSIHLEPDGTFPNGIPNPENNAMLEQTIAACREAQADLGIMLDTDADRCGFVVPVSTPQSDKDATTTPMLHYEALNRNRLIALLGVVMAREKPGSAVVTDSVTSEGLSAFLQDTLGLQHVRYIKGYANVIGKARELTESGAMNAELAIETSGHCAMRENGYLDDGTYTAVQVVSLLARERASSSSNGLLDLISEMEELDEVCELRMNALDGSLETMRQMFNSCVAAVESRCTNTSNSAVADDVGWTVDADNLEGIRVRLGQGQFFMLRQSLHDPIISLQIEAHSQEEARRRIVQPLLHQFAACSPAIGSAMDISVLNHY